MKQPIRQAECGENQPDVRSQGLVDLSTMFNGSTDVYTSGTHIPELNGVIRGGTTVVIHHPDEVGGLLALCSLAPISPASDTHNPLEDISRFLNGAFLELKEGLFQMPVKVENFSSSHWENVPSLDTLNDKESLMMILSLAYDIWCQQGGQDARLCLAMAIGDFTSTATPVLECEGKNTGLVLLRGSVIATYMQLKSSLGQTMGPVEFVASAASFAVVFLRNRGLTASKIAVNLVEDMRTKALKKATEQLVRLDDIKRGGFREKKGVIIFLHGLLSTDVGTFDRLIKKWKEPQDEDRKAMDPNDDYRPEEVNNILNESLNQDYLLVGWPHDTLSEIDNNGFELFRLLEDIVEDSNQVGEPLIAFVCHSRGGLVARSAAEKLFAKSQLWEKRLCGCVTFGTPHEGAMIAELPSEQLVGRFVQIMALRRTESVPSIFNLAVYQEQNKGFPGIQDLRPARTGGKFLSTLRQQEIEKAGAGKQRRLDIFAIGGHTTQPTKTSQLIERIFGDNEHDLVVETSSSISRYLPHSEIVECDHVSYFSEEQCQKSHFGAVIQYLRKKLQVYDTARARDRSVPPKTGG
jgi:hypothetical protein